MLRHRMFVEGDTVLCGVSGGPDSVALVHLLHELAPRCAIHLGIAHLNHGLRGEAAEADARFVEKLARTLNIPCHLETRDVEAYRRNRRVSPEEAARQVRYDFFERISDRHRYTKIALGHHADDNAELFLMNLLRGGGRTGLSGIAPVRNHRFVRPLIGLTRSDILDYLKAEGIEYRTDATNADTRFLRNRIRHHLIPVLERDYNPAISENLNRLADLMRREEEWLEEVVAPLFDRCLIRAEQNEVILSVPTLASLSPAPLRRVLRMGIRQVKGDLRRIAFTHVEAICDILNRRGGDRRVDLPNRIRAAVTGGTLRISLEPHSLREALPETEPSDFECDIPGPGIYAIPKTGFRLRLSLISGNIDSNWGNAGQNTAFFDMDKLAFPLRVRNFRPGDRFTPLGMTGTLKLKKFFIDRKISGKERLRCPLLLFGDKIIWVMGLRIDDSVKVSAATETALKTELLLA